MSDEPDEPDQLDVESGLHEELLGQLAQQIIAARAPSGAKAWWQRPGLIAAMAALLGGLGPAVKSVSDWRKAVRAEEYANVERDNKRRMEYGRIVINAPDYSARLEVLALIATAPASSSDDQKWANSEIAIIKAREALLRTETKKASGAVEVERAKALGRNLRFDLEKMELVASLASDALDVAYASDLNAQLMLARLMSEEVEARSAEKGVATAMAELQLIQNQALLTSLGTMHGIQFCGKGVPDDATRQTCKKASVSDLGPLSLLDLRYLVVAGTSVDSLDPLVGMSLKTLNLANTKVTDLGPLRGIVTLQTLRLDGSLARDIRPLSGLQRLTSLNLADTEIDDIHALEGLASLRWLNISGTNVVDLGPLKALGGLRELIVSEEMKIPKELQNRKDLRIQKRMRR